MASGGDGTCCTAGTVDLYNEDDWPYGSPPGAKNVGFFVHLRGFHKFCPVTLFGVKIETNFEQIIIFWKQILKLLALKRIAKV